MTIFYGMGGTKSNQSRSFLSAAVESPGGISYNIREKRRKEAAETKQRKNEEYVKLGVTLFAVIAAGLLLCFIIYRFQSIRSMLRQVMRILRPFVYGALFAYILSPLCGRLETFFRKLTKDRAEGWVRGVSIFLSLAVAILIIWLVVMMVVPQIWDSVNGLVVSFPEKEAAAEAWLNRFLEDRPELYNALKGYFDQFSAQLDNWVETVLMPRLQNMVIGLGSHVYDLLGAFKDIILGLLISAYMLASRRRFAVQGELLLHSACSPRWADWLDREIRYADKMFNGFLVGKLIDSAIMGLLCMIGTSIMNLGSPVLLGAIVGVTNIIPFFGPIIGAVPCALLLLLENPLHALYFVIFIIVLQQIDGNFIGPMILGDSTGLSGFWVMFAIIFFGGIWGLPGMILGVPLFAVIYDIVGQIIVRSLRKRGREDLLDSYRRSFRDVTRQKTRRRLPEKKPPEEKAGE